MERDSRERKDWEDGEQAEFERSVRFAMQRRPAPVGLKQRVLARARERRLARHGWLWTMQRVAAVLVLAAIVGGFAMYERTERRAEQQAEEQRKGEAVKAQVMLALRITHKTLDRVGQRLAEDGR